MREPLDVRDGLAVEVRDGAADGGMELLADQVLLNAVRELHRVLAVVGVFLPFLLVNLLVDRVHIVHQNLSRKRARGDH